jgi:uncharacterized protein involved in type VI secretion and phage assembly
MGGRETRLASGAGGGFAPDVAGRGFFGKFRAKVSDNLDPLRKGRLRVTAPDVLDGEDLGWALPSVPYGGDGVGLFLIPPKGANVWVEFEQGDPDYPIWTGCFWPDDPPIGGPSLPADPAIPFTKILKTDAVTITIQDAPGLAGITIETKDGNKIVMNIKGIEISTKLGASIQLMGKSVSINQGALEVI